MKKFYILIILFSSIFIHSQTLTQVFNEPVAGDKEVTIELDTSAYASGLPMVLTGSNTVWNFTALVGVPPNYSISYDAASAVPSATAFPGATVVQNSPGIKVFMKSTTTPTTQTEVLGVITASLSTTFTNSAIAAKYPISFGSSTSDNISGSFTFSTYAGTCSGKITTLADGTGTLNLPDGISYKNVLRVKSVQTITATLGFLPLGTIKQTIINYYDASEKFPVLSLNYTEFAMIGSNPSTAGVARAHANSFLVGINNVSSELKMFRLYPNPSKGAFIMELHEGGEQPYSIQISNNLGEIIYQKSGLVGPTQHMELSDLKTGIYHLKVSGSTFSDSKTFVRE